MQTIKVFSDYMSSGLWLVKEGDEFPKGYYLVNVEEDFISYFVSREIIIALNYWHHVWELMDAGDANSKMSDSYRKRWNEDGKRITDVLNFWASVSDEPYQFEYVES